MPSPEVDLEPTNRGRKRRVLPTLKATPAEKGVRELVQAIVPEKFNTSEDLVFNL